MENIEYCNGCDYLEVDEIADTKHCHYHGIYLNEIDGNAKDCGQKLCNN